MHRKQLVAAHHGSTKEVIRPSWAAVAVLLLAMSGGAIAACRAPSDATPIAHSTPQTGFFVINGLRLQFFDWGGSGTPLLLVAGGGASPHSFDDLAPRLTEQHHVVGFARRAHGQSEVPATPFTVDDLADDMRQVFDSLGIEEAVVLGFSFGGNEITRFAELYPDRVIGLIYLDAAFDWSTPEAAAVWLEAPFGETPTSADLASVDNYRMYQQRMPWHADVVWSETVEVAFLDQIRVATDGSVSVPFEQVMSSLRAINETYRRSYTQLKQPTLALFAEYYIPPSAAWDSASAAVLSKWHVETFLPMQQSAIDRLSREIADVRVARLPGIGHGAVVFSHLDQLASRIREFTSALGPSR